MNAKKMVFVFLVIIFIQPIPMASAYRVPNNATAEWDVVIDNVDAFTYLREGSTIGLTVIESNATSVNALLVSTEYVDREEIIDYSEHRCFPFIVSSSFLNASFNPLVERMYSKNLFDVDRDIVVIVIDRTIIHDNIEVTYILEYDLATGLMVKWTIERISESTFYQTIVELTTTTFWEYIKPDPVAQFFVDNRTFFALIAIFATALLSMFILWKGLNTKKVGVIRLKPKIK